MPFIQIEDKILHFRLRRSLRAKRLQMTVRQQQFEIVAPPRIRNADVLSFMWQHKRWMLKQLQRKHSKNADISIAWPQDFLSGESVPFRATTLSLNVKFGPKTSINRHQWGLDVIVSWDKDCDQIALNVKQQVMAWYQQQAMQAIEQSVDYFCPKLGRWPRGVQLKQQKTRWGSCGISEKIYINWLLILAPPGVLEYVVAHELCHLFHRNHGKRFWAKVAQCYPGYEQHEDWLGRHGQMLMPLG